MNVLYLVRHTEVDWINGSIVHLDEKHGVTTPVNRTLVGAVKGLEKHFGQVRG